jgi:hypothetical protein
MPPAAAIGAGVDEPAASPSPSGARTLARPLLVRVLSSQAALVAPLRRSVA